MTTKTVTALKIIRDNPDLDMPSTFARVYFGADHPGWRRHGKVGRGVAAGVGLCLAAGGYLGKLRQRGLIARRHRRGSVMGVYCLTPAGEAVIADADKGAGR